MLFIYNDRPARLDTTGLLKHNYYYLNMTINSIKVVGVDGSEGVDEDTLIYP